MPSRTSAPQVDFFRMSSKEKSPQKSTGKLRLEFKHRNQQQAMHILFTMAGWSEEAGGTSLPRQIAMALAERGHRITVVAASNGKLKDSKSYDVEMSRDRQVKIIAVRIPFDFKHMLENPEAELDDLFIRSFISSLLLKLKPDIVHYHSLHNFSFGLPRLVRELGFPSIYTSHNYWPICPRMYLFQKELTNCDGPSVDGSKCSVCTGKKDKKDLYKDRFRISRLILNRSVDRHVTVSQRVRQIYIQNGYNGSRIHVLPILSKTVEQIWHRMGGDRNPEGLLDRPLRVGFLGNLFAWKGAHVLVGAVQAFSTDEIECHIFGDGPETYLRALRQIDRHGLVCFHGAYEPHQMPSILRGIDLAVFPSICEETGGLAALEALAGRVPLIGSRIGGIPELIDDGVNGMLFNPGDVGELAERLGQFIENKSLLGRMQRNISTPGSFDSYLDELTIHYREVLRSHHKGL